MPLLRHCSIREGELGPKSKQQDKQGQCRHQQGPSPTIPKQGKQSRSSDGNQLQPRVCVARQVCNNEAGLRLSQGQELSLVTVVSQGSSDRQASP